MKWVYVQGNVYKVTGKDGRTHEGVFISEDELHIYLKLGSGYNIGISKSSISESEEAEGRDVERKEKKPVQRKRVDGLPNIIILHTGGTIASKVDYSTGAVIARFSPDDLLEMFPELSDIANIDTKFISNMWSEDMNFSHFNRIASAVKETLDESPDTHGIIIGLGTDMLHYASAALAFALENVHVPVLVVGSQRSSDRPSTDAYHNLLNAAYFISEKGNTNFHGVGVCMHSDTNDKDCWILPPTKIRKMHTTRRDAFQPIGSKPIAIVNYKHKNIEMKQECREHTSKLKLRPFKPELKVAIIKARPGLRPEEVRFYENYDGIILEGVGLAHFPINVFDEESEQNKEIFKSIEKMCKHGVVAMTSQVIFGRINMNVYSTARKLKGIGVLGHLVDMTPETAYVKLMWLLSNYAKEEAKRLYSEDLRGEITERSEYLDGHNEE